MHGTEFTYRDARQAIAQTKYDLVLWLTLISRPANTMSHTVRPSTDRRTCFCTLFVFNEPNRTPSGKIVPSYASPESARCNKNRLDCDKNRLGRKTDSIVIEVGVVSAWLCAQSILVTIVSNAAQIESIFYCNRLDSGDAHNTIFGSTILKQTTCHSMKTVT